MSTPLTVGSIALAWVPFILMSVLLLLTGLVRQQEGRTGGAGPIDDRPDLQTNYHDARSPTLRSSDVRAAIAALHDATGKAGPSRKGAVFNFAWLTAPGTAVFVAALLSMVMLRMNRAQIGRSFWRTFIQMKIPIPTIAFMLGLSYVTRYAGMDATLGVAFADTGLLYPFFAAILGWLGVFLTGTDAGSNALFGSLQKITATQISQSPVALPASRPGPGPGADLHRQQHRRRHGQDDRRPEHLRGHRRHPSARQGGRHLQGGRLAQHRPGVDRRPDDAAAGVCLSVHVDGAALRSSLRARRASKGERLALAGAAGSE